MSTPQVLTRAAPTWWSRARPWAALVARLGLGAVWLVAGAAKATDLPASVRAVRAYQLLPESLAGPLGAGLPWLELSLGVLLVLGVAVRAGALVSSFLLVVFLVGIASAAARGLRIDCGCFGSGGQLNADQSPAYTSEIVRDCGLLLLAGLLARWPRGRLAIDNWINGPENNRKAA